MYALTRKFDGTSWAIVGPQGRLDFPLGDGPIIADMLDHEFPQCISGCEERDGVCADCGQCKQCSDGVCPTCAEGDDNGA